MPSFEDLDIPDWVRVAWEQPLRRSDILFRSVRTGERKEEDWETNALVSRATEYTYAEGYMLAARIIADYAIQKRWDADFLVYPIVFLYRHDVELQFKLLIRIGAFLTDKALSEADRKLLQESHDLNRLWALLKPILQTASQWLGGIAVRDIEGIESYVRQLHTIDQQSYSFRYITTKSGSPSIDKKKLPHINIGVLAVSMEKLTNYLSSLGEAFREAHQVRCEIEDESFWQT